MIASKDSLEPNSSDYVMPNSRRVYVEGELHPDVRVPFRGLRGPDGSGRVGHRSVTSAMRLRGM